MKAFFVSLSLLATVAVAMPLYTNASNITSEISVSQKRSIKKSTGNKKTTQNIYSGITINDFGYNTGVKTISAFLDGSMSLEFTFGKDGTLIKATYSGQWAGDGKLSKAEVKDYANQIINKEISPTSIDITRY